MNNHISQVMDYHEKTKHSQMSVLHSRHYLDWDARPNPFKIYRDLSFIPLPESFPSPSMNAVQAISGIKNSNLESQGDNSKGVNTSKMGDQYLSSSSIISLSELSSILFFSCGVTRHLKFDSKNYYMRAASATGALYPIEAYVVNKYLHDPKLDAGVYHFNPGSFSLVSIRNGDHRKSLASYAENNSAILSSPVSIIFASNFWRNAWKYQSRSYRHWFWDCGVIVANLLAVSRSYGLDVKLTMGFIDDKVNKLLGLENHTEASLLIASLDPGSLLKEKTVDGGIGGENLKENGSFMIPDRPNEIFDVDEINTNVYPLSSSQVDYPEIWEAYDNSKLFDNAQVKDWSSHVNLENLKLARNNGGNILKRNFIQDNHFYKDVPDIGKVILKRGSSRKFAKQSIPLDTLYDILFNSIGNTGEGLPMDYKPGSVKLIDLYFIANSVEGLKRGGYYFNTVDNSMDFLTDLPSPDFSGHLCLDQSLFANASAVIFLMADLKKIIKVLGNRGYRAVQMEGGIVAGKVYLSSYAYGIGSSGSTFYDDEVSEFFSYHDGKKDTMIAVGIGIPPYKSKSGSILPIKLSKEQMIRESNHLS